MVLPAAFALGLVLAWTQPVLAACAPKNSTQPVGSCPSAPGLAPMLPASGEAGDIVTLFWIILGLSAVIFGLVMVALFINITKFSHRPGHDEEPKQIYGNRRIEVAWTLIPAAILLFAFVLTVIVLNQVNSPVNAASALKVDAIGHQWWWEFKIPDYGVVTANEVHVPVHTLLQVNITSVDVIHSFWVPQLSRQMDATPNNNNIVYIKANRTGTFPGACYEFCGQGHAWMQFRFVVNTRAKFRQWAKHQASPAASPATGPAQQGESIFFGQSCGVCHTIDGTPANGTAAPNLTHVADRWAIGGGVLVMSKQNLARWVHSPNTWKEGVEMPAFDLTPNQLRDVAAFLASLK